MRYAYRTVEGNNGGNKMDGGDPTSTQFALHVPQGFGANASSYLGNIIARYLMGSYQIQNLSGSTTLAGIAARLHRERWNYGKWVDAGNPQYVDQTPGAQNATTNDMTLESLVNNDGCLFAALDKFNLIDILVGTAGSGGAPAVELAYSGPAGWVVLANSLVAPLANWLAGEQLIMFSMPPNFTPMTVALHGTGVPVGYYGVRVRKTTAQTVTAALGTSCSLAQVLGLVTQLANNNLSSASARGGDYLFECGADALFGVIGVGHVNNLFNAQIAIL